MDIELQIVSVKLICEKMGVSNRTAVGYIRKTRDLYNKTRKQKVTLGQLLRANGFEK